MEIRNKNKYQVNWYDCEQDPQNIISVLETKPSQQDKEDVDFEPTTVICESDGSDDEWVYICSFNKILFRFSRKSYFHSC